MTRLRICFPRSHREGTVTGFPTFASFLQSLAGLNAIHAPYCEVGSLSSPIEPNFPPLLPDSLMPVGPAQLVPVSQFPPLPAVYNSASTASNTGSDCSAYTGFLPASAVTTSALGTVPSNITDNLADKPPLQQIYQTDIGSATQAGKPNTGDVGLFLSVYYWLTSCIDRLIGSPLPVSGVYSDTILGRLASMMNEAELDLTNTVVIFTSDHGEYGGAHGLYGKGCANYDEAINVPLFVQIPGVSGNYPRPQLCSGVDCFGLIAALATNNLTPTGSTTPIWMGSSVNPQLAAREQLYTFAESASTPNARVLPGGFPGPCEGRLHGRLPRYKLSTYTAWGINQAIPGTINFANIPAAEIEFYNYATNPAEIASDYSSCLSTHPTFMAALKTAFSIVAASELQAPLSTIFPSTTYSLSNSQQAAAASYNLYIDPPTGVSLSVTTFTQNQPTEVEITGTNVEPGPIVKIFNSEGSMLQRFQVPVGTTSVSLTFPNIGTFSVVVLNPSLAPSDTVTVTVVS